jgi:hypothetical protein
MFLIRKFPFTLSVILATLASSGAAVGAEFRGPIEVQGKAFVTKYDQARFMVRGVALASNNQNKDLLADSEHDYFKSKIFPRLMDLNVNVVRVYSVDLGRGHDQTMTLLKENGIYVQVGMANSKNNVNRVDPIYSVGLRQRFFDVIDKFSKYENVLGYSVGNEIIFPGNMFKYFSEIENPRQCSNTVECIERTVNTENTDAAVVKALIRDTKAYLATKGLNTPVGVAMQDTPQVSAEPKQLIGTDVVAQYYACGSESERADYIGMNSYRYVPDGPMSSYDGYARMASNFPIPVFLTESGPTVNSNNPQLRDWKIVGQNYSRNVLIENLSGQVAYEFFNETNNFGLYVEDEGMLPTSFGGADALGNEFATASMINVPMPSASPSSVDCPSNFNPAIPQPGDTIGIRIKNYANEILKATQNKKVIATLDDANNGTPSVTDVSIDQTVPLYILQNGTWNMVCDVPGGELQDGWIVKNNVEWGGRCKISQ